MCLNRKCVWRREFQAVDCLQHLQSWETPVSNAICMHSIQSTGIKNHFFTPTWLVATWEAYTSFLVGMHLSVHHTSILHRCTIKAHDCYGICDMHLTICVWRKRIPFVLLPRKSILHIFVGLRLSNSARFLTLVERVLQCSRRICISQSSLYLVTINSSFSNCIRRNCIIFLSLWKGINWITYIFYSLERWKLMFIIHSLQPRFVLLQLKLDADLNVKASPHDFLHCFLAWLRLLELIS